MACPVPLRGSRHLVPRAWTFGREASGVPDMLKPAHKYMLMSASGLAIAAWVVVVAWAVIRGLSVVGWMIGLPPARSYARAHEHLPAVSVEGGRVVCCRMQYCDFRFPLPDGAQVMRTNLAGGGADTIQGSVEIVNSHGAAIDLGAYARQLGKNGFRVNFDSGAPALSAGTSDGGSLQVDSGRITFSYFGDY